MPDIAGWDLGGAHLKVALASDGQIVEAAQFACPLWQGLDRLTAALEDARGLVGAASGHAITMTGELVDLFVNRAEGVAQLVGSMTAAFPETDIRFYAGRAGFLDGETARGRWGEVASANWLATAHYAAACLPHGLLVDIGSTTTDLVPFRDAQVLATGTTDAERLASNELVYSGLTRTPVMAVVRRVPFAGVEQAVMAEHFATTADVYRLMGLLPEEADQHPAADSGEKSRAGSARRLARMLGRDLEDADMTAWRDLADHLAQQQQAQIAEAAAGVLSSADLDKSAPLVGAGIGCFLACDLAEAMARPYVDFAMLVEGSETAKEWAACCAPAVAVALLAAR